MAKRRDPRTEMERRVAEHCVEFSLTAPGELVLLAVSGGPDSVALVSIMAAIGDRLGLAFHVGHLNHMLRGRASDEDAAFVESLSERFGLECHVSSVDVYARQAEVGGSLEAVAREVRREFLGELASEVGARHIALGHQRDDVAETVLMRLLRGAGASGLSGLRPVRDDRWIRPLLSVSRADVMAYLQSADLPYRRDASNADVRFLRNRVRHELIPHLAHTYNPKVDAALARAGTILSDEDDYLAGVTDEAYAAAAVNGGLDVARLVDQPRAIERRVVRRWLEVAMPLGRTPTFEEVERVRQFSRESAGSSAMLTRRLRLTLAAAQDGRCVLTADAAGSGAAKSEYGDAEPVEVPVPGAIRVDALDFGVVARVVAADAVDVSALPRTEAAFDHGLVPEPLTLRAWRDGDRLQPFGMAGSKRVAVLLSEAGVPALRRTRVGVLCGGDEVVWVVGHRASGRYAVTSDTQQVLHMRALPPGEEAGG